MLCEVEQELRVLHRGIAGLAGDALLLAHVLDQELAHFLVRTIPEDRADPLGGVTDKVIMLLHPLAEQAPVERARDPRLAPGMHAGMLALNRRFECLPEFTLRHGRLSFNSPS